MRLPCFSRLLPSALGAAIVVAATAALAVAGPLVDSVQTVATGIAKLPACKSASVAIGLVGSEASDAFAGKLSTGGDPDSSSVYAIGSLTKTFTALLFAEALAKGLVKSDDPVSKYLPPDVSVPSFFDKGAAYPIRLIDLATHTSGLPRATGNPRYPYATAQMHADLAKIMLTRRPGTAWDYSNLGFALLAEAMETVFKAPYEQLLAQHIAAPLRMTDTGIVTVATTSDIVVAYGPNGQKISPVNSTWPAFNGAGAIRSTLSDMERFLGFAMVGGAGDLDNARPQLFGWKTFPRAGGQGKVEQGLGWQRATPFGGELDVAWKDGDVPGFTSYVAFSQKLGVGVVALANRAGCPTERAALCVLRVAGEQAGLKMTAGAGPNCKF